MGLASYARKRDFRRTPEPADGGEAGRGVFVVQLHHASHRHFDFRLEFNGVLKSWSVPKGPSFDPAVKRLAVEVEDHPLSYAAFEGDIPAGNYGAGHVELFDSGTWVPLGSARDGLARGELKFELRGDVLRGSWVLVRTRKVGSKQQWLLIKHADEYAGPRDADAFIDAHSGRPWPLARRRAVWPRRAPARQRAATPVPRAAGVRATIRAEAFAPQLCQARTSAPDGEEWLHEIKWDGYRMLASVVRGKARLWSRNGENWTQRLPRLAQAVETLGFRSAQLDGEIVVLDDDRASFNALQARLADDDGESPVYLLFDLVHADGYSLRDVPLIERKRLLAEHLATHPHDLLRYSEHQMGHGAQAFAQAKAADVEGIVSKRVDSRYTGTRSGDWIKLKTRASDDFIVVGFTEPKGTRNGLGALLLARPDDAGKLIYVGRAGSGFDANQLRELRRALDRIVVDEPVADIALMAAVDRRLAIWVAPRLVVEVYHAGSGGKGLLRQASFKALRRDRAATGISPPPAMAARARAAPPSTRARKSPARDATGVTITHPQRIVYAKDALTKADVAAYYASVADVMLPELVGRPLSVVRCPDGIDGACFFQKHAGRGWGTHVHAMSVPASSGRGEAMVIRDLEGMLELVQANVLEFHVQGSPADDPDHAGRLVFDLDPDPDLPWKRIVAAAREVRAQLDAIGMQSFVRTSGGKGLHVVVPLDPPASWDDARAFSRGVAEALAGLHPETFVAVAGSRNRKGRIFVDWLRNGRGATSIAAWSLRARASAGVAMPVAWEEIGRLGRGDAFSLRSAIQRLARRRHDPWQTIDRTRQTLPA